MAHFHHLLHHYWHHIHWQHASRSPAQEKVLLLLLLKGSLAQGELINELRVQASSVSEVINKLEQKKLIKRRKETVGKKELWIDLTPMGEKVAKHWQRVQKQYADQFLQVLTEEEREQLVSIMEKLHDQGRRGDKSNFSWRGQHWSHDHDGRKNGDRSRRWWGRKIRPEDNGDECK
jgi:DNA-binding MarR family transcriptional regulator